MSAANTYKTVDKIDDIWLGSDVAPAGGAVVWSHKADPLLQRLINAQHPLVLVGRNSNASGRKGALAAADDLHGAAEELAKQHGFDVTALLPSVEDLADGLMQRGMVVKSKTQVDGVSCTFTNRFLIFDMREHGVVLSLSTGSAKKLDVEFNQPHVSWLCRLIADPALAMGGIFAKRIDRFFREEWSVGRVMHRLREVERLRSGCFAGDGTLGRWDLSPDQDVIRYIYAVASRKEAADFDRKRKNGARRWTDESMTNHVVRFGVGASVPPGMYRYRDNFTHRWHLAIDSPALHPHADKIAGVPMGVPAVKYDDGTAVDQAANVRWLLSRLGRPGEGIAELLPELLRRRYSTESLRQQRGQGPGAYYGGPTKPADGHTWDPGASWLRSILNNLETYETGVLTRSLGSGEEPITIINCFPPGGKWAETEDFDRIKRYVKNRNLGRAKVRTWSWYGLPVTVNGIAGQIQGPSRSGRDESIRWAVGLDAPLLLDGARRGSGLAPTIPEAALMRGIYESLEALDGQPLHPAAKSTTETDDATVLANRIQALETESARLATRIDTVLDDAYAEDDLGNSLHSPAVRARLVARSEKDAVQLDLVAKEKGSLLERRDEIASATAGAGSSISTLEELLRGLCEPGTPELREELRRLLNRLDLTVTPLRRHRLRGYAVHFDGEFTIRCSSGRYTIPFAGDYELGAAGKAPDLTETGIAALRSGELPINYSRNSSEHAGVILGLEALGADPEAFRWRACEDSQVLKLAMETLFPPAGADGEGFTGNFDGPDDLWDEFTNANALSARIRRLHKTTRSPRWLKKDEADMEVRCMISSILEHTEAAGNEVTSYTPRQLQGLRKRLSVDPDKSSAWDWSTARSGVLGFCPRCSSPWIVPMRFDEAAGYVCLECRHDRAGVTWPRRFDRFVAKRDLWAAAGAPLEPGVVGQRTVPQIRARAATPRRKIDDLGARDRSAMVDEYVHRRDRKVSDIAASYDVDVTTLMSVVREAGAPTRYKRTERRWAELGSLKP